MYHSNVTAQLREAPRLQLAFQMLQGRMRMHVNASAGIVSHMHGGWVLVDEYSFPSAGVA